MWSEVGLSFTYHSLVGSASSAGSYLAEAEPQTNHKDPDSKFQTNNPPAVVFNSIITNRAESAKRCDTTAATLSIIEY